jgi:hypothetical protein
MKSFLILASLLSLMACKAEKSSQSKSCTYNDEPVDCSTMNPIRTKPFTLISNVKANITLLTDKIEILENTESIESEIKNGISYECKASTFAGDIFTYSIEGKNLKLKLHGAVEYFTRISGQPSNIIGVWKKTESNETGATTVTVTFTEKKMELNVNCFFK